MKNQNIVKLALEAQNYEDDEILALRDQKVYKAMIEKQAAHEKERKERFARYFFRDGTCKEHDRCGCNECRYYANGNCPSAREEHY